MLLPGVRLVERPGVLHFFDGRRVVSIRGDHAGQRAIHGAIGAEPAAAGTPVGDARDLLERLRLATDLGARPAAGPIEVPVAAAFASASVAGWVSPGEADERLRGVDIYVWDAADDGLLHALVASGLRCTALRGPDEIGTIDPGRSLVAVVAEDGRPTGRLHELNEACLSRGVSWLPVGAYDGATLRVGPLMIPGQTACFECLLRRLAANVEYAEVYRDIADAPARTVGHRA